jgi:hypothetical protein
MQSMHQVILHLDADAFFCQASSLRPDTSLASLAPSQAPHLGFSSPMSHAGGGATPVSAIFLCALLVFQALPQHFFHSKLHSSMYAAAFVLAALS